jgi:hypothetical protein
MRPGTQLLYYHSNCPRPGIAGLAEVGPLGARAPWCPFPLAHVVPAAPLAGALAASAGPISDSGGRAVPRPQGPHPLGIGTWCE